MKNTLLISKISDQTRFALLENNTPIELRLQYNTCIGDIFLGIVLNINKSLGLAFVDLGKDTPGLLPLSQSFLKNPPFHEGEKILVQVTRDPENSDPHSLEKSKSVRLSLDISFPTPFFIFLPRSAGLKFSRNIPKDPMDSQLSVLKESLAGGEGLIIRSLMFSVSMEILQRTLHTCQKTWQDLQERAQSLKKPELLLKGAPFLLQYILHHMGNLKKIITNDKTLFHEIKEFLELYGTSSLIDVECPISLNKKSLFEDYDIEEKWETLKEPIIDIPLVGHLILEKTAAFWVFDVNSSSFDTPNTSLSPFDINLKAGEKILYDIRLKNLSGTIIVDFIPLRSLPLRQKLLTHLQRRAAEDPTQTHIHGISPLGLCEITRTKKGPSVLDQMAKK